MSTFNHSHTVETQGRVLLGMLTPSSNTVLEPVTHDMLSGLPEVSAHFGRFRVTEIALSDQALAQFDTAGIMAAAELLSHAHCHTIGWNGTSASWLGFDSDERLCRDIASHMGVPGCTSVLALNEVLTRTGVRRFGLVSPYRSDVQQAIVANYARSGFDCSAERHLELQDNYAFSNVSADTLRDMVADLMKAPAGQRPQAIAILCTNLRGAPIVAELEDTYGVPVYDSIAVVVWKALRLAGVDVRRVQGWGSLFNLA